MQGICEKMVDETDSVLGCALVDLATGLPVASDVKPESVLTEEAMMVLFSAVNGYFAQSSALTGSSPDSDGAMSWGDGVQEIQTTTKFTFHFMARVPGAEQMLLVLVTSRSHSSLGLGWMAMRRAMALVHGVNEAPEHPAEPLAAARATAFFPKATPAPEREPAFTGRRGGGRRTIWDSH